MNIKIACPSNVVTGGVELLHQVAAELNKYDDVTAELWYLFDSENTAIPDEYLEYDNRINNFVAPGDILIFPEIWANLTNLEYFKDHQKIVYWCGVNAYFTHNAREGWFKFGEGTLHISQSEYSKHFLLDVLKVDENDIIEITDYINDAFLKCDITVKRDPIVLYNPAKGMEFTEKLIALVDDISFIPIQGMTRAEIIALMKRSMVWIDFGDFPGKDRLPREAGACGMVLITSRKGTAKYQKDLDIPVQFKLYDVNYADLDYIAQMIRDVQKCFTYYQDLFRGYRNRLRFEKWQFETGIKELLEVLYEV